MILERLKRSLILLLCFTIISSNIPFYMIPAYAADNVTQNVEETTTSESTPLSLLERQILSDEDFDLFQVVSMLISYDAFYETFIQLSPEMKEKFYEKLSNEDLNQLLFYAEMIFVKKVIEMNFDTSEETIKTLKDYATIYAEFKSKEEAQEQASEKDVAQAVSEAQNLYFTLENSFQNAGTFDEYYECIQDSTTIDIDSLISQLRQVTYDFIESSLEEFGLYLLSAFENENAPQKETQENTGKENQDVGNETKKDDIIILDFVDFDETANEPIYSAYLNDDDRKKVPSYFPEEIKVKTKDGETAIEAEWEPMNEPYTDESKDAFQYRLVLPEGYALSEDLRRKFENTDAETPFIFISVCTLPDSIEVVESKEYPLSNLKDAGWKNYEDEELNEYFWNNNEENIYNFFINLPWEEQEELIARDTLLSQEIDAYMNNDGDIKKIPYYEYLRNGCSHRRPMLRAAHLNGSAKGVGKKGYMYYRFYDTTLGYDITYKVNMNITGPIRRYVTVEKEVPLRESADSSSTKKATIGVGNDLVYLESSTTSYYKVRYRHMEGYVSKNYVSSIQGTKTSSGITDGLITSYDPLEYTVTSSVSKNDSTYTYMNPKSASGTPTKIQYKYDEFSSITFSARNSGKTARANTNKTTGEGGFGMASQTTTIGGATWYKSYLYGVFVLDINNVYKPAGTKASWSKSNATNDQWGRLNFDTYAWDETGSTTVDGSYTAAKTADALRSQAYYVNTGMYDVVEATFDGEPHATLQYRTSHATLDVKYNTNGGTITSSSYSQASGGAIYKSDGTRYVQSWTYDFNKDDGLINASTFGLKRDGYSFGGWQLSDKSKSWSSTDSSVLPSQMKAIEQDGSSEVTLYAVWVPNTITFNYYSNNGAQNNFVTWTVSPESNWPDNHWNYGPGSNYPITYSGYNPTGYYGTTGDGKGGVGGTIVQQDESFASYAAICSRYGVDVNTKSTTINLYAQWAAIPPQSYTITYHANGGTNAPSPTVGTVGTNVTLSSSTPTPPYGYNFSHWANESNASGLDMNTRVYHFNGTYIKRVAITKIASNTIEIMAYCENTSSVQVPTWTSKNGQDDLPTTWDTLGSGSWNRGGYTFNFGGQIYISNHNNELLDYNTHVYAKDSSSNTLQAVSLDIYDIPFAPGNTWMIHSNHTLYAQYKPWQHTVAYNANGGTGAPESQTKTYGYPLTLRSEKPTRSGHTFIGWNTASNGTGQGYQPSGQYGADQNGGTVTLYAQWVKNGNLTFDPNGGKLKNPGNNLYMTTTNGAGHKNTSNWVPVTYGSSNYNAMTGDIPTYTGYSFQGWYESMTASSQNFGTTLRVNMNGTANGWAMTSSDAGKILNATILLTDSSLSSPPKIEFNDVGLSNTEYSVEKTSNGSWRYIVNTTITSNMVSQRGSTPYDTTYRFFDFEGVSSNATVSVGGVFLNTSRQVYNASGNCTNEGKYWSSNKWNYKQGDVTLYAKWEPKVTSLIVNPNGGSWNGTTAKSTFTQKYKTNLTIANPPTRAGYTFAGWSLSGSGMMNFSNLYMNFNDGIIPSSINVYNNSNNGTVTHALKNMVTPVGNKAIEIKTSGTASPGLGGFYNNNYSVASQKFVHVFIAKIPVGFSVTNQQNSCGNGYTVEWLTPKAGTGDWEVYAYRTTCGSSGSFSSFGHVNIEGSGTNVTWYLASSQIYNETSGNVFTFGVDESTLTAMWIPNMHEYHYNKNESYNNGQYANTGLNATWDDDFSVTTQITIPKTGQRYLVFGNYNATDTKAFNVEITADNKLRLYFGTGQVDTSNGTIAANQPVTVTFRWMKATNSYQLTATGSGSSVSISGTYTMSGTSANSIRIGTQDYRGSVAFNNIKVSNTIIKTATFAKNPPATTHRKGLVLKGWYTGPTNTTAMPTTAPSTKSSFYAQWRDAAYTIKYNNYDGAGGSTTKGHNYYNYNEYWGQQFDSTQSTNGEYMNTGIDLAPHIDQYGVGKSYLLEFDAYANKEGNVNAYIQNGNGGKHSFSASFNATTSWKHYSFEVTPTNWMGTETKSLLAFYGTYGSGVYPHVKNVEFTIMNDTFLTPGAVAGYQFGGWATSQGGSKVYDAGQAFKNLSSTDGSVINLYAIWNPISYSITYDENGGSDVADQTYNIQTSVTLSAAPIKQGYDFKGWKLDTAAGNWTTGTYSASQSIGKGKYGNIKLVAQWEKSSYKIEYDENGGTTVPDLTYTAEDAVTLASSPSRTGYTFNGWKLDTAVGNWTAKTYSANEKFAAGKYGNIKLVAQWTPVSYKITYDENGGTTVDDQTYNIETAVTLAAAPSKTGYTFNGWKLEIAEGNWTATTYNASQSIGKGKYGNIELVAQWTPISYKVTYNSNLGLPAGYKILSYIEATGGQYIDTGYKPTSENYKVYAEFSQSESKSSQSLFGAEDNRSSSSRQWSIVPHGGAGYFAHYVGNSAGIMSASTPVGSKHIYTVHANNGKLEANVDGNVTTTTYVGVLLKGLNTFIFANNIDGSAGQFTSAKMYAFKIYDNNVLKRNFIPCISPDGQIGMYDVVEGKFYANAGSGTFKASENYIDSYTYDGLPTGYEELDYIETSGTQYIDTGISPSSNNVKYEYSWMEITPTAGWSLFGSTNASSSANRWSGVHYSPTVTENYLATATTDGVARMAAGKTAGAINVAKATAKNGTLTRTVNGTTATGSYSGSVANGTNIFLFADNKSGQAIEIAPTVRLYYWKMTDNGNTVRDFVPCKNASGVVGLYDKIEGKFYANAGSGTFKAGPSTKPLPSPSRTGYTFGGWYDNAGFTGTAHKFIPAGSIGNKTFYAKWTPNTYTVKFDANHGSLKNPGTNLMNGTVTDSIKMTYDSTNYNSMTGDIPVRKGYIFVGWNTERDGTGVYVYDREGKAISGKYWTLDKKWWYMDDVWLYAQWEPYEFTISYDANGGTGTIPDQKVKWGQSFSINDNTGNPKFTKNGYKFNGWTTIKPTTHEGENDGFGWRGTGTWDYENGTVGVKDYKLQLYARWVPNNYTVEYYADGTKVGTTNHTYNNEIVNWSKEYVSPGGNRGEYMNTGIDLAPSIDKNGTGKYVIEFDAKATKDGFMKVYLQNGSGAKYYMNQDFTVSTEYKHYRFEVDVSNGVTTDVQALLSFYCEYDTARYPSVKNIVFTKKDEPLNDAYQKEHYDFIGWKWTDENGVERTFSAKEEVKNLTDKNGAVIRMDAVYKLTDYPITYDLKGGALPSGKTNPSSYTYADTITLNNPVKDYHTFAGWKDTGTSIVGNKYVLTNTTEGNSYNSYKLQLWTSSGSYITQLASATASYSGTYTHTMETGTYNIRYGANGNKADNCYTIPIYLENGKTYNYGWEIESFSGQSITAKNVTFCETGMTGPLTAIHAGTSGSKHYEAIWIPNKYKVTLDNQGATTAGTPAYWYEYNTTRVVNGITAYYYSDDDCTTPLANGYYITVPQKTGYIFGGYYTERNGSGTPYVDSTGQCINNRYKVAGDITLFAKWTPITYTITYDENGGSAVADQSYTIENAVTLAAAPTKKGHTFKGWKLGKAAGNWTATTYSASQKFDAGRYGNIELVAQWEINTYTNNIEHWVWGFEKKEGNNSDNTAYRVDTTYFNGVFDTNVTFSENRAVEIPNGFYLDKNSFAENSSGSWAAQSMPFTTKQPDREISAQYNYRPHTYNITYVMNGGTNSPSNKSTYNVLYGFTLSDPVTRSGYEFDGWYLNGKKVTGINESQLTFTDATTLYAALTSRMTGDITLEAKWDLITYTIEYDENGGSAVADQSYTIENAVTLSAAPTRTGYTFKGWKLGKAAGNWTATTYSASQKFDAGRYGNIELVAQWEINTYTNYISHWAWGFEKGEGNNSNKAAYNIGNTSFKAAYNTEITFDESCAVEVPNGFYLNKNSFPENSTGTYVSRQMPFNTKQPDKRVDAQYNYELEIYDVTYKMNGGTNPSSNKSSYNVLYGFTLSNPTERPGYQFNGWYLNGEKVTGINANPLSFTDASSLYTALESRTTGDITLEAKWTLLEYSITYDLDEGSLPSGKTNPTKYTVETDTFTLVQPTKPGYSFIGWTGSNGDVPQKEVTITKGSIGDKVYVANWGPLDFTVCFDGNGATGGSMENQSISVDTPTKLNVNEFTRTGYLFEGWNTKADGSGESYADEQKVTNLTSPGATVILYAQWKRIYGYVRVQKETSDPDLVAGNDNYTLEGAEYTVYDSNGNKVGMMTTDENGKSNAIYIPYGTYKVIETKASPGYKLDPEEHEVKIRTMDETVIVGSTEDPYKGVKLSAGIYHTTKWDNNRGVYNTLVEDPKDRNDRQFWAGEKFIIGGEFFYEDDGYINPHCLIYKVEITNATAIGGGKYEYSFKNYIENEEYLNDITETEDGFILKQKGCLWKDDMVNRWGKGTHDLTFKFTYVDGKTETVNVTVNSREAYYKLHRVI